MSHVVNAKFRYPRLVAQLATSSQAVQKADTWASAVAAASAAASTVAKKKVPEILPSLGASGAIYAAVTMTALAFPDSQIALFIPPSYPINIQWGVGGLVALDMIGILRGWRYATAMIVDCLVGADWTSLIGISITGHTWAAQHLGLRITRMVLRSGIILDGLWRFNIFLTRSHDRSIVRNRHNLYHLCTLETMLYKYRKDVLAKTREETHVSGQVALGLIDINFRNVARLEVNRESQVGRTVRVGLQ